MATFIDPAHSISVPVTRRNFTVDGCHYVVQFVHKEKIAGIPYGKWECRHLIGNGGASGRVNFCLLKLEESNVETAAKRLLGVK